MKERIVENPVDFVNIGTYRLTQFAEQMALAKALPAILIGMVASERAEHPHMTPVVTYVHDCMTLHEVGDVLQTIVEMIRSQNVIHSVEKAGPPPGSQELN